MKLYYTFGSDKGFPFQNGYLAVEGLTPQDCHSTFRSRYPDRDPEVRCLNCSDYYTEKQWERILSRGFYKDQAPFTYMKSEFLKNPPRVPYKELIEKLDRVAAMQWSKASQETREFFAALRAGLEPLAAQEV